MGLLRVASSVLVLHAAFHEAASRAGVSPLVQAAVAAAASTQASAPSLKFQALGEEAAGSSPTVSVEQALRHQRRVDTIFIEVWNRVQALFGGPKKGPLAPLAPNQMQRPPNGLGPPLTPQTPSAIKAAEREARRSDYLLQKRQEMEGALASWMAVMEGGDTVPHAEQEAAEQQGLQAVRFVSDILKMSPKQFTNAFYKAHPINPALSSLHRKPTELTDLIPFLQAVNHAVESEAGAQQAAASEGRQLSPEEASLLSQRKTQALLALKNQARSNRRLARIRSRVLHEASWALKPGDKLKAEIETEYDKWIEEEDKAKEAISHCRLLGLKTSDRQRPLLQPQETPQGEETITIPAPSPPTPPAQQTPPVPPPLDEQLQTPAGPPPPPALPTPRPHSLIPAGAGQALAPPSPILPPTPPPLPSLPPAVTVQVTRPQMPVSPSPPPPLQQPVPAQPSPPVNPASFYKGRVAALSRMFAGQETSTVQQQQQQQQQHIGEGPYRPSLPRPSDLRLLKRTKDMNM
ncbi:hypothetical protein Emag_007509 [Eimeria magna]